MRRSRFHEGQVVRLPREQEVSGLPVAVFMKRHGGDPTEVLPLAQEVRGPHRGRSETARKYYGQ